MVLPIDQPLEYSSRSEKFRSYRDLRPLRFLLLYTYVVLLHWGMKL
jgi:hypothetical protein